MKAKNLIPLVVLLVILVILVVVKKTHEQPPGLIEEAKLEGLVPEGLSAGDIARLELYAGAKPEEKVTLAWDAEADKWRVSNHYNAPAKEDKIDEYLDDLVKLKGEFRAKAQSDDALNQYELADDRAFHVDGFKKDADTPAFRLLVGKAPDWRTAFMRPADGQDVYVTDVNLRQKAGIYGDDMEKTPEPDTWLDKTVIDLEKDDITRVELDYPDKRLVFEKHEKEKPAETEAPQAEEGTDEQGTEEADEAEAEVEYEWVTAFGGPGGTHKQTGLDALLRKLDSLTASDIVDPAKKDEWGLERPSFTCTVSLEGQEDDVVIEGGRPDTSGDGYVRLADAKEDLVYKLSKWTFEQLFPNGTELFDLPKLSVDNKSVGRVELTQPEGHVVLVKAGDEWSVAEPGVDLDVVSTKLDTLARTLASWKASDYADSAEGAGFEASARRVTFAAGTDESHTIALGSDSQHIDGAYARLDDAENVLVMSRTDIDKVFVPPKDLYERKLFDVDEDDITAITVARNGESFNLTRANTDEPWQVSIAGAEPVEADEEVCDDLAMAIADLQASDILFGETELGGEVAVTVQFTAEDGDFAVNIAAEQDDAHPATISGKKVVFLIDAEDIEELLPPAESLKKPEPEPEPESEAEAETEPEPKPEAEAEPEPGTMTEVGAEAGSEPGAEIPTAEPADQSSTEAAQGAVE